jgi:membrane protein
MADRHTSDRRRAERPPAILESALGGILRGLIGSLRRRRVASSAKSRSGVRRNDSERGRDAQKPSEIPAKGWWDIAWRVYEGVGEDRLLLVAAGVTFYGLLALFPATAALVSLYGLFTDASTINDHLARLSGFLPGGALEVIGDQVKRIVGQGGGKLGFAFVAALALSLWGANAGTKAIFDALNIIYKEREKRNYLKLTLQSVAFTLAGMVLLGLAAGSVVVFPVLLKALGIPVRSWAGLVGILRWPLLLIAILCGLACLYRYGPSRTQPQWRWVTWGGAFAAITWLTGSLLYSWYVGNFGMYNKTYGSLGALVGFMIWMWLSAIVVLVGAEINAEMEHQTGEDTTKGGRKPLGARGAHMADEVGEARS